MEEAVTKTMQNLSEKGVNFKSAGSKTEASRGETAHRSVHDQGELQDPNFVSPFPNELELAWACDTMAISWKGMRAQRFWRK